MKKLLTSILIAFSLLICNGLSAQETVKHVVQKGETLASIAANYGVTVVEITNLNPKAQRFLFVGMELQIPSKTASPAPQAVKKESVAVVKEQVSTSGDTGYNTTTATTDNSSYADAPYKSQSESADTPKTVGHFMAGYDLSLAEKADDTSVWGASFLVSVDEYLTDVFYFGLGGGMSFGGSTTKVGDFKATSTAFSIMFPLYFGITPVDGIDLDTGPSFNWVVGGGIKQFDGSKKISEISYGDMEGFKHFSPTWRVSVRLVNYIYVGVNIGLKKNSGTSMTFGLTF